MSGYGVVGVVTSGYELLLGVYGWLRMVICGYEWLWDGCRWLMGGYEWLWGCYWWF